MPPRSSTSKLTWDQWLVRGGAVAGAILAIAGGWHWAGLPIPAWSQDVRRLEAQQLDTAIEVYQQKQRSLVLQKVEIEHTGATDSKGYQYVSEDLEATNRVLSELRTKKIELSR